MTRLKTTVPLAAVAVLLSGCGGGSGDKPTPTSTTPQTSAVQKSAANSLRAVMDNSSRAIDRVSGTRSSLLRLSATLEPRANQTSDVIAALGQRPDDKTAALLKKAAQAQRDFLTYAGRAVQQPSRATAVNIVERANQAGRRATDAYDDVRSADLALAGLLPAAQAFNTGNLRSAVVTGTKPRRPNPKKSGGGGGGGGAAVAPAAAGRDCGGGVTANNSVTSCPFALNVASEYRDSGGASTIDVYSPVTKTNYTLSCTGGSPVTCTGGNNASISIR